MIQKKIVRFKTRFDTLLFAALEKCKQVTGRSKASLISAALETLYGDYKKGLRHFKISSDFLNRDLKQGKIETEVYINSEQKEKLRRLAFTMTISQAEVLRVALESYLFVELGMNKQSYYQKNRYTHPRDVIGLVLYEIFTLKIQQFEMRNRTSEYCCYLM